MSETTFFLDDYLIDGSEGLLTEPDKTSVTASSFAYVDDKGAFGSSSAAAFSPNGDPSTSQDSQFILGETSVASQASATATSDGDTTSSATVKIPADSPFNTSDVNQEAPEPSEPVTTTEPADTSGDSNPEAASEPVTTTEPVDTSGDSNPEAAEGDNLADCVIRGDRIDKLIGTNSGDTLVCDSGKDVLWGRRGADTFVLGKDGHHHLSCADIISDFDLAEGDKIQLPTEIAFSSDLLETIDFDDNGVVDSTVIRLESGDILAVVRDTVDSAGNTLLSADSFI